MKKALIMIRLLFWAALLLIYAWYGAQAHDLWVIFWFVLMIVAMSAIADAWNDLEDQWK